MSFKLVGLDKVQKNMKKLVRKVHEEGERALEVEAQKVLDKAKQLAPVKTGRLRDSGRIEKADSKTGPAFRLRFGDEDVPYAAVVHETHKTRRKFLQRAVLESGPETIRKLKEHFDRELFRREKL